MAGGYGTGSYGGAVYGTVLDRIVSLVIGDRRSRYRLHVKGRRSRFRLRVSDRGLP